MTTLPGLSPIFSGGSLTTKDPLTVPRGASRIDPEAVMLSLGLGLGLKTEFFGLGLGLQS